VKRIYILISVALLMNLILVGCVNKQEIAIIPAPGSYLRDSQNISSEVVLQTVKLTKGVSDKQYRSVGTKNTIVNAGEPIWVLSGSIQNKHSTNKEITMYAEGYDDDGRVLSWTLDAAHILGQIGLHLDTGATSDFSLHMYFSEEITTVRIFASNYPVTPP
jgi:hypothetical protein